MSGALTGVSVLDFTQLAQGPFATQILGDMGADIIKIEPLNGDWMRNFAYVNLYPAGESVSFLAFNRNKRSVAVNLKTSEGLEIVRRIAARADVAVENFRPGVMERLGIGYGALAQINPRLIFCSSSGFGASGPYVNRPGQDLLIQAMAGGMVLNGKHGDFPMATAVGLADLVTGLHIAYAISAALFNRERTGQGQAIECNLYSSLLHLHQQELTTYLNGSGIPERSETNLPNPYLGAPYGLFETADHYIAIAMNPVNKLARLVGVPGFETMDGNNVIEDRDDIRRAFMPAFRTRATAEWLDILLAEDIWCSPVYSFAEVETDPQVLHNGIITSYQHPTVGTVRAVGLPVNFLGTPAEIRRPAPLLGQHTAEVLGEFGYSPGEIRGLAQRGIVTAAEATHA
jgi:crotonobetainyl-CoA:carnitine CoA-transferase CaiB-like acyl-CoA transferase